MCGGGKEDISHSEYSWGIPQEVHFQRSYRKITHTHTHTFWTCAENIVRLRGIAPMINVTWVGRRLEAQRAILRIRTTFFHIGFFLLCWTDVTFKLLLPKILSPDRSKQHVQLLTFADDKFFVWIYIYIYRKSSVYERIFNHVSM